MLRREQLCPGGPSNCPEVYALDGGPQPDAAPCTACPGLRLDLCLQFTEAGRLVRSAMEIDWASKCGIQIRMEDVSYPEFLRLRMLAEERQKFELEERERQRQQAEGQQHNRDRMRRGR